MTARPVLQSRADRRFGNVALSQVLAGTALLLASILSVQPARGEDGYELWLRYRPMEAAGADADRGAITALVAAARTPTQAVTRAELLRGLGGLLAGPVPLSEAVTADGALIVGTPASSPLIRHMKFDSR